MPCNAEFAESTSGFMACSPSGSKLQPHLLVQPETFPVIGGDAMDGDGIPVLPGRVPFVLFPLVMGVFFVDPFHVLVAVGLGEYGGCCDGIEDAVTLDHSLAPFNSFSTAFRGEICLLVTCSRIS